MVCLSIDMEIRRTLKFSCNFFASRLLYFQNPLKLITMAGNSKETPRQKMIGLMYLVLTAMLALNVSKDILK